MDSISSQMDAMIRQALTGAAIDFAEAARDEAPFRTHDLQNSIHVGELEVSGGSYSISVGVDPAELGGDVNYAPYVHDGTGIFGPRGQRIVPKTKKALKTPFRLKSPIAGQKANPFFKRAWDENKERILKRFQGIISAELVNFKLVE